MEIYNTKIISCLVINTDSKILPCKLVFDFMDQNPVKPNLFQSKHTITKTMTETNKCAFEIGKIAKAMIPAETYYYAFYESDTPASGKKFNKIATHLINNLYNMDIDYNVCATNRKCYGNCYILHMDSLYNLYDIGLDTFINLYNKVHTLSGIQERHHTNRIYKKADSNKYYLYEHYAEKNNCVMM